MTDQDSANAHVVTCSFGGNLIRSLNMESTSIVTISREPYLFQFVRLQQDQELTLDGISSISVCVAGRSSGLLRINGTRECLGKDDVIHASQTALLLNAEGGVVDLVIAGTTAPAPSEQFLISRAHAHTTIAKPWGWEVWLDGNHEEYCFKKIGVRRNLRESLQYHRLKKEHIIVYEGGGRLYYRSSDTPNDQLVDGDIGVVDIRPGQVLEIDPRVVHRIAGVDDVLLYEVSTPHREDVVRIMDDWGRKSYVGGGPYL